MSFDAGWLELRAPADAAARDPALLSAAAAWLGHDAVALDLGCGTGAACSALAAPGVRWRLVDGDAGLLRRAARVRRQLKKVAGDRPRLSVHRSSKHIYAQIIDDAKGHTLAAASTIDGDLKGGLKTGAGAAAAAAGRPSRRRSAACPRAVPGSRRSPTR